MQAKMHMGLVIRIPITLISRLLLSKSRVAPLKSLNLSTPELCGAHL